ncbi:MAG TPA: hypothetical protein VMX96_11130 [Dehalococcoidia bacterium]|nr:hypothetical protein [Dehalococcoidia bacterium]
MGSAGRDNYVCLNCGAWWGHRGKCDHCGAELKADRLLTEDDSERLVELAKARTSGIW